MLIHEFIQMLETKTGKAVKKSNKGYSACCPSHDDSNPSLSVSEGLGGKVLINCFAGCTVEAICESLGIGVVDLFPEKNQFSEIVVRRTIKYTYQDENGIDLCTKVRTEPGKDGKTKSFYWERVDENGNVIKGQDGCRKVLYRLPELQKAIAAGETIFLVEGEKDANKLIGYGLAATTSQEALYWREEFTQTLTHADVVVLYDMDKTGLERCDLLCKHLSGRVKRLRVVDLPGLEYNESHGKDVSNWLEEGHTVDELLKLVSKATEYGQPSPKEKIRVVSINEFLKIVFPKREMLLAPFLPTQGLGLLYAKCGVGKTHVALGIAYAVATGGKFLRWQAPAARKVLYIDGEMPAVAMQERLNRIAVTEDLQLSDPSYLRLITQDLQDAPMPDLSTAEGQRRLEEVIEDTELIIIDNISTCFRTGVENDADSWQPVQDWALGLRRRGKSVLFVHHAGKGGKQRGTSKREDILDVIINLEQPPDYHAGQGASFIVSYEKARHFAGDNAASFQACLKEQEDGLWIWEISDVIDSSVGEVAEAINEGLTIAEIMKKTGLSKSKVETRKKKAKMQELI